MPEDAQIAESSTATVETPVAEVVETPDPGPIESWTQAQRDKFMDTGEMPGSKPTKKSDSAPDDKAEPPTTEKADEKQADPAPAKPKKSADDRVQQLLVERARERQEFQRQLAEAKAAATKPNESESPKASKPLEIPDEADYGTFAEYKKAMVEYYDKLSDAKIEQHAAKMAERQKQAEREQYEAEVQAGWESRFNDAFEAHAQQADFQKHVEQAAEVFIQSPGIAEYIMTDEYGPQMAEVLGQDLKRAHALIKISSPVKLAQALADLKYEVRTGNAQKAPAKAESELPVTPKPASKASAPPPQLSTAAKAPADEVQAALESGDVRKYMDLMNARELKAKRG